jgi:protein-disulfide isomerase
MAAEAVEAAAIQGKFWEMHDLVFENQQDLQPEDLMRYARDAGLDMERFGKHLYDRTFGARVTEDFQSGIRAAVKVAPTFFLNGVKFEQDWSYNSLLQAIRSELDQEIIRRAI